MEHGGYVCEGKVGVDGTAYSRGSFVSKAQKAKAIGEHVSVLKFEMISGLKLEDERISHINEVERDM